MDGTSEDPGRPPRRPPRPRRLLTRRRVLAGAAGGAAVLVGTRLALPTLVRPGPAREPEGEAGRLVERALAGLDRSALWDVHVHAVGLGRGGSGCWVSPDFRSHASPLRRLQFDLYAAAAGIDPGAPDADRAYLERLLRLHRAGNPDGRICLLAFDWHHAEDGQRVPAASTFHVPNDWVLAAADREDDVVAFASVHPYRADALAELDRVAARGARAVKWLPNAMGMDPASELCDPFYERMAELGLPLLAHTGHELAVESAEHQELGNPLRLRRALEAGVRVIAAHCAGSGTYRDPDDPASPTRPGHEWLLSMMDDPRWADRLLADVSATTQVNRSGDSLRAFLERIDLHDRLLFGSDYPLPAVPALVSTRVLRMRGYLREEEPALLNEVFDANPLLFDLVVKRRLRVDAGGTRRGFADAVFDTARHFRA